MTAAPSPAAGGGLPMAALAPVQRPCRIAPDHPAFAGHFPGQPILPGVLLLAEVLEAWRALRAEAPDGAAALPALQPEGLQISAAKFLAPVRPGALLHITLQPERGQLRFQVHQQALLVASGSFIPGATP